MRAGLRISAGTILWLFAAFPADAGGQGSDRGRSEIFAGSTFESYLRYLQTLGKSPAYPISIRGFSAAELDRIGASDSTHPWSARYSLEQRKQRQNGWSVLAPSLAADFNSGFAFGGNDGPTWRGKGVTVAAQAGVAGRIGAFSAVVSPIVFRAQNASFPLLRTVQLGAGPFADASFPLNIDRPQRFGDGAYSRADPGESSVRFEAGGVGIGISTASQWWGPTTEFAPILGNNAGGFPHFYFGTGHPANIGIGQLHGRVVYGYLQQSEYSPVSGSANFEDVTNSGTSRFMAGIVALITIRGVPGMEIGGSRFFHSASAAGGVTKQNFALPFQGLLKSRLPVNRDTSSTIDRQALRENQLASVFFRWAPPGSGFDVYGELAREDHSSDLRDFFLEPDHAALTNVGFRRAWMSGPALNAVRAEVFLYDPQGGLQVQGSGRTEGGVYIHSILRQGHTQRGQLLGADVGPGSGNAQVISYERFTPRGRHNFFLRRAVARESVRRYTPDIDPIEKPLDVLATLGTDLTWFVGTLDLTASAALTREYNRYLLADRSNATLGLTLRYPF